MQHLWIPNFTEFLRIQRFNLRVRRAGLTVVHMWVPAETAVQELREALALSIRQLAREAGVSHTYLSRYERGEVRPSRHWLRRVAAAEGRLLARHHKENRLP